MSLHRHCACCGHRPKTTKPPTLLRGCTCRAAGRCKVCRAWLELSRRLELARVLDLYR